ncbi:MAG: hypothetical protein HFI90_10445 [Clostridia bacterium]|nr:hypothetical protein [Clostridia bacterium]
MNKQSHGGSNLQQYADIGAVALCMLAAYAVIWCFNGCFPWAANSYNSYALQAQRWLQGHLDLGQDYSHLEIAVFGGRYFVSFPPFPSIVLLPFVLVFGTNTPDHLLCALAGIIGAVFLLKLAEGEGFSRQNSVFLALLATICGNFLFIATNGGVWFMAQTFAFALSACALWCLRCCKARSAVCWGLFLWACAVGCRPLNAVYAPLLLYLVWRRSKEELLGAQRGEAWNRLLLSCLPAAVMAAFYMTLNFARFGNVLEFGHNYLPEFTESTYGQFSTHYLAENVERLLRLPAWKDGKPEFPLFDGVAFWLVSPVFLVFLANWLHSLFRREKTDRLLVGGTALLVVAHFLLLALHKTMGGWHFGNRYTVDAIPFLFLALLCVQQKKEPGPICAAWCLFTFALNVAGTVMAYLM